MIVKIVKASISEQVFQQMKDNIVKGVWKRGEKIPSEMELAELFDVSRNTVRSGIQRLSAMGMLTVKHGKGSMVTESIYDNDFDSIPFIEMDEEDWIEIINFRLAVECAFVRLAALNRDDEDLRELKRRIDEIIVMRDKKLSDSCALADLNFHTSVAKASKNKTYYNLVVKMRDMWFSQQKMSKKMFDGNYLELHNDIYAAILDKDPERAAMATKTHFEFRINDVMQRINDKK